jgi:hypothetical protein
MNMGLNLHDDKASSMASADEAVVEVGGGACCFTFKSQTMKRIFQSSP